MADRQPTPPTLRALLAPPRPAAAARGRRDGARAGALDRPVRWVHSSDLADPTPFLSEGLVLLTTGTQFQDAARRRPTSYRAYVRRLRARGVVGLGFGTEVVRDGIPPRSPTRAATSGCRCSRCRTARRSSPSPARTPRRSPRRRTRAAAGRWPRSARSRSPRCAPTGSARRLAELARQLDTWVGMYDAAGDARARASGRRARRRRPPTSCAPRWTRCCGAARARRRRCASAARLHPADPRPRRPSARRHRDGRRRPRPGGPRRRHGGDRDGRARARAARRASPARADAAARGPRAVAPAADDPAARPPRSRATCGAGCRRRPFVVAVTDAAAARATPSRELLELRVDERRGTLFFGRGDDGLVVVRRGRTDAADRRARGRFEAHGRGLGSRRLRRVRRGRTAGAARRATAARARHASSPTVARRRGARRCRRGAGRARWPRELAPLHRHDAAHGTALVETRAGLARERLLARGRRGAGPSAYRPHTPALAERSSRDRAARSDRDLAPLVARRAHDLGALGAHRGARRERYADRGTTCGSRRGRRRCERSDLAVNARRRAARHRGTRDAPIRAARSAGRPQRGACASRNS